MLKMVGGIQASVLNWISDFLFNRTQKVLVGGQTNDSTSVLSDVPQLGHCPGAPAIFMLCSYIK